MKKIAQYLKSATYTSSELDDLEEEIKKKLNVLRADSNIKNISIADRWKDGYFKISIELKPISKKSVQFNKNRAYEVAYELPDLNKIKSSINKFFKGTKFLLPKKKKEFVERGENRQPKNYYTTNWLEFEIYV